MQRPNLEVVPPFYKNYVLYVQELEMLEALQLSNERVVQLVRSLPETKAEFRYQPGKWSIKELLCHMLDAERIFAYRALRFARNDNTALHGFEENDYAPEANAHARTFLQLADEMTSLRKTTLQLFGSFTTPMLARTGKANNTEVSVLTLGYIIAGHETHHRLVLQERYLKD